MKAAAPNSIGLYLNFDIAVEIHLLGGPPEGIKAKIRRVSSGLVELSSSVYLPPNQKLEMLCEGRTIQSRVAYCRRQSSGTYDLAIRMGPDEYIRTETRTPVDLATKLHVLGSPAPIPVRVVDLSPSGIGMDLPVAIPVGARVSVSLGYCTALGEIRHCASKGQTYRAGIRLEKLIRCKDANARVWTDLNSGSGNTAALAAFARSIEERQLRSEAILLSLASPLSKDSPSDQGTSNLA